MTGREVISSKCVPLAGQGGGRLLFVNDHGCSGLIDGFQEEREEESQADDDEQRGNDE
jgi:hypothetical protein